MEVAKQFLCTKQIHPRRFRRRLTTFSLRKQLGSHHLRVTTQVYTVAVTSSTSVETRIHAFIAKLSATKGIYFRKPSTCRFRAFVRVGLGYITIWPYFPQLRPRHRTATHLELPSRSRTDCQLFSGDYSDFSRWCTTTLITFSSTLT